MRMFYFSLHVSGGGVSRVVTTVGVPVCFTVLLCQVPRSLRLAAVLALVHALETGEAGEERETRRCEIPQFFFVRRVSLRRRLVPSTYCTTIHGVAVVWARSPSLKT